MDKPVPARKITAGQPVNYWWRSAAGLLGLAGLLSGGTAIFVTHVEAGPVALVAAGLVFALIAMSGRMPSALKYGDAAASFEQTIEEFVMAVAEIPGQETPELVNALENLAMVAPRAAAAGLSAVSNRASYDQLIKTVLMDIASELPPTPTAGTSAETRSLRDLGVDFKIRYRDQLVLADIRYSQTPIALQVVRDARSQAAQASALVSGTPNLQLLLITNQPLSKAAQDEIDAARPGVSAALIHVLVRGADDSAKLELAVRRALGLRN
jgi:hypothetical protein